MEKHEERKIISGIALLFIIITSVFSFLEKLTMLIIREPGLNTGLGAFARMYGLWFIVVALIIAAIIMYSAKNGQKLDIGILDNSIVRSTSGILIILKGLVDLSVSLPTRITAINSAIEASNQIGQTSGNIISEVVITNATSVLITMCQIFFGFYLIKLYKKKLG